MKERKVTKTGLRIVCVGFYSPEFDPSIANGNAGWMNRLASWWTSNDQGLVYSHVELRFSDGALTSITRNPGTVHYIPSQIGRLLSNPGYNSFWELYCTAEQEEAMQRYAMECARVGIPFNGTAQYWNFIPGLSCLPIRAQGSAFFCSEYVTTLLQRADFLQELDAATTSPTQLHDALVAAARETNLVRPSYNVELRQQQKK